MRYIITKFVDADNLEQALKKASRTPIHEIYIHTDSWKDAGYALKKEDPKKVGYAEKDR